MDRYRERDNRDEVFSEKIRAGKRTYIFDVRTTRNNDYYITITERKRQQDGGMHKQKLFLYKEDFNKFVEGLDTVVNHIKTELLPDYDYEQFDRKDDEDDWGPRNNNRGNDGYDDGGQPPRPRNDWDD